MAGKGWLYPTYPKEYGGGGLTPDHETILQEEFQRYRVSSASTGADVFAPLLVWATEEQKQKFLVPLLKAEKTSWQKFTEPQSGADLASYQGRAVREGDDWILTGQNVFISGWPRPRWNVRGPDYLWGPMLTDPDAPRHRNLGFFMIPVPSPGLTIQEQNLVNGWLQHFIFMDGVRVSADHLIGGDHQGWQVTNTLLEQEHGGRGQAFPRDEVADNMVSYVREANSQGAIEGQDSVVQQIAMQASLEAQVDTLLQKRTYWMYQQRMPITWEGIVANVYKREHIWRNSHRVREIMGLYAQLGTKDHRAPFGGQPDAFQRNLAFGEDHAGGSLNIAKVIAARRVGISRTKERPAPTPATATKYGS